GPGRDPQHRPRPAAADRGRGPPDRPQRPRHARGDARDARRGGTDLTTTAVRRGRPGRRVERAPAALVVPATVAAVVALLPMAYLVVRTVEAGPAAIAETLLRERTLWLVLRSVGLAAAVTAGCLVIGVGLAWLTVRTDVPGRRALGVLATLPLAMPSYVAAYAWVSAAPQGAGFWGAF